MNSRSFGDRLSEAMFHHGRLAVGIDPHPNLLAQWGLSEDPAGLRRFALGVVEALGGRVAAFKPQVAFFERFGSAGIAVLEETIDACAQAQSLCIVDAKRGDIGSTMRGYAEAFLAEGSPLAGDAVTLSPYLGVAALMPALELAAQTGRGVFVLALTSNREGMVIQHARSSPGTCVAASVVSELATFNRNVPHEHFGPAGVVIGATVGDAVRDLGIDLQALEGVILAPGVGAQGAGPAELDAVFASVRYAVLASSSRAILSAGPDPEGLRRAYDAAVQGFIEK